MTNREHQRRRSLCWNAVVIRTPVELAHLQLRAWAAKQRELDERVEGGAHAVLGSNFNTLVSLGAVPARRLGSPGG
jgi:hypothetical protein